MNKKIILSSLALDLKRAAMGFHRGSIGMAEKFIEEARKRKEEAVSLDLVPYIRTILQNLDVVSKEKDSGKKADDLLMYSTRIQNYIIKSL